MKKAFILAIIAVLAVFFTCIFISCNNSSDVTNEVYMCETVEFGTNVSYSLSFDGRTAKLYRRTAVSYSSFSGEVTKKSDGVFILKITSSADDTAIPDYLAESEITISGSEFTFSNRPAITYPTDSRSNDTPSNPVPSTDNEEPVPYPDDENNTDTSGDEPVPYPDGEEITDPSDDEPTEFIITPITPPAPCTHENLRIIPGVAPTCTENGYTDETVCAECRDIIIPRQPLAATGHKYEHRKCSICDAISLPGLYSSETERSSCGDELVRLINTEKSATLLLNEDETYLLTKITLITEIYPAEASFDGTEIILHNNTTAEDLSSPTAPENGFDYTVEDGGYTHLFTKVTETEECVISEVYRLVSDSAALDGATGFYTKTAETKEIFAGNYAFTPETITLSLSAGICCSLDLSTDSFAIMPSPVTVNYLVNGSTALEYTFPDSAAVENYLSPLTDDLAALDWFTDSDGTLPYSTARDPDITENSLSLYAFKEYKDVFRFGEYSFEIKHGSYEESYSFENAANALLSKGKTSLASDGYALSWTENGEPVASLSVPPSAYALNADREFILTVSPGQNRMTVSVSDASDNLTYLYFPEEESFLACDTPDAVLTVIGITESEKLNYNFVSNADFTSFTRTFTGITVTYIRPDGETSERIRALDPYAVGADFANEKWFTEDSSYSKGDSVTLSSSLTLYSRRFVVSLFDGNEFVCSVYCGDMPASLQSEPVASYAFLGFFAGETALSEYVAPSDGEITITAVYSSSAVTKTPTETEAGLRTDVRLTIEGEASTDTVIPALSETDYTYSVTLSPSLMAEGEGLYSSAVYGDYTVTIPKLTSQTISCGGDVYEITINGDGTATVSYNGTVYQTSTAETADSIVFTVSSQSSNEASPVFAASLSAFGGFSVYAVTSEQQAEALNLATTTAPQTGKSYFSYEDEDAMFLYSDFYYIADLCNNYSYIGEYPDPPYEDAFYWETCYVQSGLYFSLVNGIVLYSTDVSRLPQSEYVDSFDYYAGAKAYKATADSLTFTQDNGYTLIKDGVEYNGSYKLSSDGKTILLYETATSAPVSFIYTCDDEPSVTAVYE